MAQIEAWIALAMIALAIIEVTTLSKIMTVWFSRKLGVEPQDIERYDKATDDTENEEDS